MLRNLVLLLFWTSKTTTAQSIQVPTTKIYNYKNADDSKRIFYTNSTKNSVFQRHNPNDFPVANDLELNMLAVLPGNCSCPDLRAIHSVTTANGQLKFERADMMTPDMIDHGFAGYLAPFPFYCGSDSAPLFEFYSEVLKKYRYEIWQNMSDYFIDYMYLFRPVRVLGYGWYPWKTTPNAILTGPAPFIAAFVEEIERVYHYKSLVLRFDVVRVLTKNGRNSYAISPELVKKMVTQQGWTLTDEVQRGPMSKQNELEKIRQKCPTVTFMKCRETFDPATGFYRPINSDRMELGNKIDMGDCGYFISYTPTITCSLSIREMFSYIPASDPTRVMYTPQGLNNVGVNNSVGYASGQIFSVLKL